MLSDQSDGCRMLQKVLCCYVDSLDISDAAKLSKRKKLERFAEKRFTPYMLDVNDRSDMITHLHMPSARYRLHLHKT